MMASNNGIDKMENAYSVKKCQSVIKMLKDTLFFVRTSKF